MMLDELEREVGRMLGRLNLTQEDGRVSPAPDARTIRYYTSMGLLERPAFEGRKARYGRRHVLQLVAIKALQAESLPLARIQERLYGRTDAELEALLAAASEARRRRPVQLREVRWREITLEPGLKLVAEEGWSPRDPAVLEEKIRAALAAWNGGSR